MTQKKYNEIPKRQKCVNKEYPYVAGARDIFDDEKKKNQQQVNADNSASFENHQQQLNNKYNKSEVYNKEETYSKAQLNNMITTPNQKYVTLVAESGDSLEDIFNGVTGESDTTYRVGNWDGSANSGAGGYDVTVYSEYAFDGTDFIHLSTKTQIGEVFDISAYHATGGTLATYADLSTALGTNGANIPQSLRKGGMSIKFVLTSDNKYVQFRCKTQSFSADPKDWYFEGDNTLVENPEFKSVSVDGNGKIYEAIKQDETKVHFLKQEYKDKVVFREKVVFDDFESLNNYKIENDEFSEVIVDIENKILESRNKIDGTRTFNVPVRFKNAVYIGDNNLGDITNIISDKYVKIKNPYGDVIGTYWQNGRTYTDPYYQEVYNEIIKSGIPFLRDNAKKGEETVITYQHGIKLMFLMDIGSTNTVSDITNKVTKVASIYDGENHEIIDSKTNESSIFRCKVGYLQGFNEPDLGWNASDASVLDYFNKTKLIYNTAKSIRPELKILVGLFSETFLDSEFFQKLITIRDEDGRAFWDFGDIVDFHFYSQTYTELRSTMERYRNICNSDYGVSAYSKLGDKPLWMSEFGTTPFFNGNEESARHKVLPKQALIYLSYGIEKVFIHRSVSLNTFETFTADRYYGIINPLYSHVEEGNEDVEASWAGFKYADGTPLTLDELLNKTYINKQGDSLEYLGEGISPSSPNIITKYLPVSIRNSIIEKGISFNGKGFTVEKIFLGKKAGSKYEYYFEEIQGKTLWTGSREMDGSSPIIISAADIASSNITTAELVSYTDNGITYETALVAKVSVVTNYCNAIGEFQYFDSYYSMKCLASVLSDIASPPNFEIRGKCIIVSWKTKGGITNHAVWSSSGSVSIKLEVSEKADIFDVKGNKIDNVPNTVDDSPIYIINSNSFNIKI